MDRVLSRKIDPGKVFDLDAAARRTSPRATAHMDERRAIKTLLRV